LREGKKVGDLFPSSHRRAPPEGVKDFRRGLLEILLVANAGLGAFQELFSARGSEAEESRGKKRREMGVGGEGVGETRKTEERGR